MKVAAILLCAGTGERYDSQIPKQYHLIHGKKIYLHPLEVLENSKYFSKIILVIGDGQEKYLDSHNTIMVIKGGKTRQESVFKALKSLTDTDYVVICDGVRPFLTQKLLKAHIKKLEQGEIAVNTCIPCHDTINIKNADQIVKIPKRDQYLRGQTPQSFSFPHLLKAHINTKKHYTDDCALILEFGNKVSYVPGSELNIKITTPLDLLIAQNLDL
jgi:2-C-methyl-D-erythritol 4-phosphate cytidylyltransferase